jgi:hypothetical protein
MNSSRGVYIEFSNQECYILGVDLNSELLRGALRLLGETLEYRGVPAEVAITDGSALLLEGLIDRATRDGDVVGRVEHGQVHSGQLPEAVRVAVADVAADLGLEPDWLNTGPGSLVDMGLPPGFLDRARRERYGAPTVHVAGRLDQIHFKLYAAVDQGPDSRHTSDLAALRPTAAELRQAAAWCRTHDPSDGFAGELRQALGYFGVEYE